MRMNQSFKIGQLAHQARVNIETVRYYERKGLITQPIPTGSIRLYTEDHLARIRFIKRAQELGFTLKESSELMDLSEHHNARCSDLAFVAEEKISEIEQKIKDLKKMKKALQQLVGSCEGPQSSLKECGLYQCFKERQ